MITPGGANNVSAGRILIKGRGAWNDQTEYHALDVVSHQGGSFMAKQTSTGVTPVEGYYWQLLASGTVAALSAIGDVNISNPQDGQTITWDSLSSKWINTFIIAGLIPVNPTPTEQLNLNIWIET